MCYKYKNAKCYNCKHEFMRLEHSDIVHYVYETADTGELLDYAKCPMCGIGMLLIPHVLEGIPENTEGIIKSGIRF